MGVEPMGLAGGIQGAAVNIDGLSSFTIDALAHTHGAVEEWDAISPTWDGKILHIARLPGEADVLHEIAHWIVADKDDRKKPNYACGQDPDGGPVTAGHPYMGGAEEAATLVTQMLLRLAGLPWGYGANGPLPWTRGLCASGFWLIVADLRDRGIDAQDPLRGLSRKTSKRRQSARFA